MIFCDRQGIGRLWETWWYLWWTPWSPSSPSSSCSSSSSLFSRSSACSSLVAGNIVAHCHLMEMLKVGCVTPCENIEEWSQSREQVELKTNLIPLAGFLSSTCLLFIPCGSSKNILTNTRIKWRTSSCTQFMGEHMILPPVYCCLSLVEISDFLCHSFCSLVFPWCRFSPAVTSAKAALEFELASRIQKARRKKKATSCPVREDFSLTLTLKIKWKTRRSILRPFGGFSRRGFTVYEMKTYDQAKKTCLSYACLSHRFIFEDYTPTNFDTFPAAIMTVFQVWK